MDSKAEIWQIYSITKQYQQGRIDSDLEVMETYHFQIV